MSFVVAIDGPAGSGKGTLAKGVAEKLNFVNVDTGAMYRCVALKAIQENIKPTDEDKASKMMQNIDVEIKREGQKQIFLLDRKRCFTTN